MKKQVAGSYYKLAYIESEDESSANAIKQYMVNQGFTPATPAEWENTTLVYEERYAKL